jgi:hypothetical protein
MLRIKISSDLVSLDTLNSTHKWIPNSSQIRPCQEVIEEKNKTIEKISNEWNSFYDFILHSVFKMNYLVDSKGIKRITFISNTTKLKNWVFEPVLFRYNIHPDSNHWVLWNLDVNFSHDYQEEFINSKISELLYKQTGSDNFQFVWYKNPKPSIPQFYHIQVFWILVN